MILSIWLCVVVSLSVKNSVLGQPLEFWCGPISSCFQKLRYADKNSFYEYTCRCDKECSAYDDCCIDSLYRGRLEKREDEQCVILYHSPPLVTYAKVKCPESWDKQDSIKSFCERNNRDLQNPYSQLPVTNPQTLVTYKNYYCAICHNDNVHSVPWELDFFHWRLEHYNVTYGNLTENFGMENLAYNEYSNKWGVWLYDEGKLIFFPFDLSSKSDYLYGKTRRCTPNVVSDCHPSWRLEDVREKCLSYMDVTEVAGVNYRNVHCAMCNYQDTKQKVHGYTFCTIRFPPAEHHQYAAPFSALFDINSKDTINEMCGNGTIFDVYTKECREATCLPGEILSNGECTRER